MNFFSFGKRRRHVTRRVTRKPPARLLKMCKKYRIKTTKKVGRKRVYRSVTTLKKLLRKKMKKVKGTRKVKARKVRRTRFGGIFTTKRKECHEQKDSKSCGSIPKYRCIWDDHHKDCSIRW